MLPSMSVIDAFGSNGLHAKEVDCLEGVLVKWKWQGDGVADHSRTVHRAVRGQKLDMDKVREHQCVKDDRGRRLSCTRGV